MFYGEEKYSACLLDFKDTHNVFRWVALNVNITPFKGTQADAALSQEVCIVFKKLIM